MEEPINNKPEQDACEIGGECKKRECIIIKTLLYIMLIVLLFSLGFTPMRTDNDVWWHLKTGKYIVENNYHLPKYDVFAYTSENIEWHNHEWLSQVIFYWAYMFGEARELGGVRAVILLKTIMLVLTGLALFLLILRRERNFAAAALAVIIAALLTKRTIYVRPPIFTYFLLALYLFILYEVREKRLGKKALIAMPPLMILWANLHGGFLTGLIAIGAFWTETLANYAYKIFTKKESGEEKNNFVIFTILLFVSFLASLCTPYGINLYFLSARVMKDVGLVRAIPELMSPDFFFTWSFEAVIIFFIIGFGIIKKRLFTLADAMLLIFFFHQAIQHVRHIALFGIVAAAIIGKLAASLVSESEARLKHKTLVRFLLQVFCLILIVYSVAHKREGDSFLGRNARLVKGVEIEPENYPVELADFILANPFHGNMYNQINYAGYLIWRMSPEKHRVFTDSRFDIFGSKFVWDMMDIENATDYTSWKENYEFLLNKYKINFVVVTRGARLNTKLELNPKWKLVYFNIPKSANSTYDGYSIFVRNIPENAALIESTKKVFAPIAGLRQRQYPRELLIKALGDDIAKEISDESVSR